MNMMEKRFPLRLNTRRGAIDMTHGSGGRAMAQLIEELFAKHFDNEYLDFDLVRNLRAKGIPSLVFTVNDIERARELRQAGVAGIFTDYPSKMLQID